MGLQAIAAEAVATHYPQQSQNSTPANQHAVVIPDIHVVVLHSTILPQNTRPMDTSSVLLPYLKTSFGLTSRLSILG